MSYTNPTGNSSATINENAQDLYIFNSVTDVQYDPDPYAKILTMSGGKTVTYTNVTISSGGTATIAASTLLRDITVSSGGSLLINGAANLGGLTIESGGWARSNGNSLVFSNFTIKAGGYLLTKNANFFGRNNFVAAGTLAGYLSVASDSVDGVIYGFSQTGGAYNYYDIVFSNFTNTGGYTYLNSGCSIYNGSAINAAAGFAFVNSGYLNNAKVTNGYVWMHTAGVAVSLGGAETTITQGHWYQNTCAGTTTPDPDLYAADGVLYGVTLKNSSYWLRNLTIVDGLTINAPVVSSGGSLYIGSGGIAATASVADNGRIEVRSGGTATGITATDGAAVLLTVAANTIAQGTKNGSAFNITGPIVDSFEANNGVTLAVNSDGKVGTAVADNGGIVTLTAGGSITEQITVSDGGKFNYSGGVIYNLTVKAGGSASAGATGVGYHGVTVEAGGYLRTRTATYYGTFEVAAGTLEGDLKVTSDSVDGVFCGGSQTAGAMHWHGTPMSNYVVNGKAYCYLYDGATVRDGSATYAQGGFAFCSGGYLYNAQVTNGWIWTHQAGANVSLGGAETNITKGNWYHCAAGTSGTKDSNIYAEDGVLYDATIKNNNGNWLRNLTVLEGLTISAPIVSSGGSLTIGSGGIGSEINVKGWGRLYVSNGGVATGASGTGGLNVYEGGILSSATVNSTGSMTVFDGGLGSDVAVESGAKLYVSNGGAVKGLTVSTGALNQMHATFSGTAQGSDISIYGGKNSGQYCVTVYDTAVLSKVYHSGGGLWVYGNGTVKEANLVKGETVFQDNTYGSDVRVSGGTAILYVRNNALVENLHMSAAEARFDAGTVRNAVFEGAIGQLKVGKNFLMESASFLNGAVVSVTSGGILNSATVNSGAQIQVSSGGEVTNLVLNGAANANRVRLYDGGHISGATISGTAGDRNYVSALTGNGLIEDVTTDNAGIYLASGGVIRNVTQRNGAYVILRGENPYASGATVSGGNIYFQNGAKGENIVVTGGRMYIHDDGYAADVKGSGAKVSGADLVNGSITVSAGGKLFDLRASGGTVTIQSTGTTYGAPVLSGAVFTGGQLNAWMGTVVQAATIGENAAATINGTMEVKDSAWNVTVSANGTVNVSSAATVVNMTTIAGAHVNVVRDENRATIAGDRTNAAASTFFYAGSANGLGMTIENGVVRNLGADGNYYRLAFGTGITVENADVRNGWRISALDEAVVSGGLNYGNGGAAAVVMRDRSYVVGMTLSGSGNSGLLNVWDQATAKDIIVSNGGVLRLQSTDNKATGTVVHSGGWLDFIQAASIEDTTLKAGAKLVFSAAAVGADTGEKLTLDFEGTTGNQSINIDNLGNIADQTAIVLKGETAGNTYTFATTGATDKYVTCYADMGLYTGSIKAGETINNIFAGTDVYSFNAAGTAITVTQGATMTDLATAGSIADGTVLATGGRAAKWTQGTTAEAGATYHAATGDFSGEAWLEIDGTNLSGTTLYGADATYNGTVNLYAANDAVLGNLAAGATSSGTVESVKLTLDGATVGLAYAGGFGTVANAVETLISSGAVMQKDFYAGALANYAKTGHATQIGSVNLTIEDGEFSGNIYGASSVKAGAATSLVHSVGNVNITVKDGETRKGNQACLFAGGYATGTAVSENAVYTVGDIDVTIDGGNWGAVAGGRGVFGGAFASTVTAEAENVSITINGGTFGNVYGGGWSQQGGTSIAGDVDIDITGGTIANVFGGGTHSTTGGSTTVGDVTINVSGGNITGDIYVGGRQTGDTTGAASVNFTGDQSFACGVYGYSYDGGTTGDAVMSFSAYTGTFSGKIGGFVGITLDDDTAMTLGTAAADVSNGKWTFDFTDRDAELVGTSFLTWSTADFAGDTVRVNFADADQAAAGWSIATAAFDATTTFTLAIGGVDITSVAYDTAISDGDWVGWKFTDDNGTLKFKHLA